MASAAMELRVLINILTSGNALKGLTGDAKSLADALSKVQGQADKSDAENHVRNVGNAGHEAAKGIDVLNRSMDKAVSTLKFLAGGFLALESVRFLKDLADTAARAEVLATVLHVVGFNAGYSVDQLDKADRQIQALGITASASRQALTQFIEAGLELSKAGDLARGAQDAAVILGVNSSEAFSRLVTAVQTGNTLMLRHMGIIVQSEIAYSKYAQTIGKTAGELTNTERSAAFLNATLEEQQKISGAYIAAMGDVGKQLTSLDRLTENLKQSLGNQLLPAYLAIVEELTLFLQDMKLVSDEMYGQGDGARTLGDAVRYLGERFRETMGVIIEYRKLVIGLVSGWVLLRYAIVPVLEGIAAFGSGALATSLASSTLIGRVLALVSGLGLLTVSVVTLGVAFIGLELASDRVRAGVGALDGAIATVIVGLDGLISVGLYGLEALFASFFEFIEHPFGGADYKVIWDEFFDYMESRINGIKWLWDNTKASFEIAFPTAEAPQTATQKLRQEHISTLQEELKLMAQITDKTREYNTLKAKGDDAGATKAKKELDALKTTEKDVNEKSESQKQALKYTQAQRDSEAAALLYQREQIAKNAILKSVSDAREKAKFGYDENGAEIGKEFGNQLGQFNTFLNAYTSAADHAGVSTKELMRNFREAGQAAKTSDDFARLQKNASVLAATKGLSAADRSEAREIVGVAKLQVDRENLQKTAPLVADAKARNKEITDLTIQGAQTQLDILKEQGEKEGDVLEDQYKQHLVLLDDYYTARKNRIVAESQAESVLQQKHIDQLIAQQKIETDPRQKASLQTQIEAAQEQQRAAIAQADNEQAKLDLEKAARVRGLKLEVQTGMAAQLAGQGGVNEAIAQMNFLMDQELLKYKELDGTKEGADAAEYVRLQRLSKEAEIYRKHREEAYQIELGFIDAQRDQLDLAQQQRDAAEAADKLAVSKGQITGYEAQRRANARIDDQLVENRQRRSLQEATLAAQRQHMYDETLQLQREGEAQHVDKSDDIAASQQKWTKEIKASETALVGLDKTYSELQDTAVHASDEIEKHFMTGFADAFTKSITDFRNAGKAWVSLSKSIADDIVGVFVKAFTERLFKKVGLFTFVDRLMDSIFGGGSKGTVGKPTVGDAISGISGAMNAAEGGPVSGPGTGTSDSIPAMLSHGEHVMPASKAAQWMPLLEGIRLGRLAPAFALGGVVSLQSIASTSVIPRRYAGGGVVIADGGASSVMPGGGGPGNMTVALHPDTLNMTMREWLEHEVVRQYGRR